MSNFGTITQLMTIQTTKMARVNMYPTIGGVKTRVFGYTPEIFFTVAPRSLVGAHFPYIIMALEGGNSIETT